MVNLSGLTHSAQVFYLLIYFILFSSDLNTARGELVGPHTFNASGARGIGCASYVSK
jgi:hypothetical protein